MADLSALIDPYVSRELVTVSVTDTVGQALTALRDREIQPRIFYLYAVDAHRRLHGVVPVRALLAARPEQPLTDILVVRVQRLRLGMTVGQALDFFLTHRFLALPVVEADDRLVGTVLAEQFADTMVEMAEGRVSNDIFEVLGVRAEEGRLGTVGRSVLLRFPWLLVNVLGGVGCAAILGVFTRTLQQVVAAALFIPVVLVLAESVGMQATALAVRRFHTLAFTRGQVRGLLVRELRVALCLGALAGLLVAWVSHVWQPGVGLPAAIALAIVGSITVAAALGTVTPALFRAWRMDPAIAAGPLVLAVADNVTIFTYLSVVHWLAAPSS